MSKARDIADLGAVTSRLDTVGASDGALSNRNLIINGAMQVAQRGTSVTAAGSSAYSSPDRFRFQTNLNTNSVLSQDADAPDGFSYSFKLTVGTGATPAGSDFGRLYHRNEGYEANQLNLGSSSSKAITLSFWVKASVTGSYGVQFADAGNGAYIGSYAVTTAATWEYKTITIPAGIWTTYNGSTTNGTGFQVCWDLGEGPTRSTVAGYNAGWSSGSMGLTGGTKILATTGATFQITGVQLEVGDTATPFEHRSYGDELQRCMRYFQSFGGGDGYEHLPFVFLGNGTVANYHYGLPVEMRAVPSLYADASAWRIQGPYGGNVYTIGSFVLANSSTKTIRGEAQSITGSIGTNAARSFALNNTAVRVTLDAEL